MLIFGLMQKFQYKSVFIVLFLLQLSFTGQLYAQQSSKCGFDKTIRTILINNPGFADSLKSMISGGQLTYGSTQKTTATSPVTIPVVFHVVLTNAQLNSIGGEQGVIRRIDSQMAVLNRDFNALNPDSTAIPGNFKTLFGNAQISFGLAHTAPDGAATPGYEIITGTKNGFDIEGGTGSGFGFSDAKYASSGGAEAWDPESYLNIWVINPLEEGSATNILGLAIPPYLATLANAIGKQEVGIIVHYAAFGKRSNPLEVFIAGSDQGRTLTHEVGHFFELLHIWGDDEGKCPGNTGLDDGIADTPPQAYSSVGCYTYPKYDACTKTGDGIMFMNYMDYSNDRCLLLFTNGQTQRMRQTIVPGGRSYGLTQQTVLLNYPTPGTTGIQNEFTAYPNPADNVINVRFSKQPQGLSSIYIVDISGRLVASAEYEYQSLFYSFDVAALYSGVYFLVINFESGKDVRKVFIL